MEELLLTGLGGAFSPWKLMLISEPKAAGSLSEPLPPSSLRATTQSADVYSLGIILKLQ